METRIYCLAAMPDPESKKQAWQKIQNKESSKLSQKEMEEVILGFAHTDQPHLTAKYNDAFFATLHDHFRTSSYKLFKTYMHGLMPRKGEITDDILKKLQAHLGTQAPAADVSNTTSKQAA